MKVYVLIWHYIESDGLSGVFLTRKEAEEYRGQAAGRDGSCSIHEVEVGRFYEDKDLPSFGYDFGYEQT